MDFPATQRAVARSALPVTVLAPTLFVLAVLFMPALGVADEPGARLAFALRCDLFVLLWLLAAIARIARTRFHSPSDVSGSGLSQPSEQVRVQTAVLQNTLEQVILAVGAHLIIAVCVPIEQLVLVPVAVAMFCVGRFAFWRGYIHGAPGRAFGFAATFQPTVMLYAYSLGLLAWDLVR